MDGRWISLCCLVMAAIFNSINGTEVTIKLYPLSKSEWSTTYNTTLTSLVASQANGYCWSTLAGCNLAANATFDQLDVGVANLEDSSKSLSMGVTLNYPSGASLVDNTLTSVPAAALEAIIGDIRDSFFASADVYITYVGEEYYGIPPDSTANAAIIPVAFLVVIVAAVVTGVMVKYQSNKEREETLKARQERRQAKEGHTSSASNNNNNALETTTTTFASATTTPRAQYNSSNQVSPDKFETAASNKMLHYGNFSVNDFTPEEKIGKNGLTPLPESKGVFDTKGGNEEDEAARKERKRRRKERKREKERLRQQQMEDSLEMYDNQGMDSSVLTESSQNKIPTFKVESGGTA